MNGLGRVSHIHFALAILKVCLKWTRLSLAKAYKTRITDFFCNIRQSSSMIQMETKSEKETLEISNFGQGAGRTV